jgi:hypothetical protein
MLGEVVISDDRIQLKDSIGMLNGGIIMDKIAKEVTEEFCRLVHTPNACILDIGFGLGYSANKFYELGVKSYTVIEINNQIYNKACKWAKDKPNVKVLMGDWQNVIPELKQAGEKFDGIFMDTYGDNKDKYSSFERYAKSVADHNCILSIYEYPSIRDTKTLNFVYLDLPQKSNYPIALKASHKLCWSYFVAGEFRKDKYFERTDNFLSDELCDTIIEENKDNLVYKEGLASIDGIQHSRKFYHTPTVYNAELESILNNTVFSRFKKIKFDDLWIGLFKYEEGNGYDRHVESKKGMPLDDPNQMVDCIEVALNNTGKTQIYDEWWRNNRETYSTINSKKGQMLHYKTYQHIQYNNVEEGIRWQLLIFIKNNNYNKHPI